MTLFNKRGPWSVLTIGFSALLLLSSCDEKKPEEVADDDIEKYTCASCGVDFFQPEGFPAGYDFGNTDWGGGEGQREHGWKIFAGLMTTPQNGSMPWLYQTWPTITQAMEGTGDGPSDYRTKGTQAQEHNFMQTVKDQRGVPNDSTMGPNDSITVQPPHYVIPESVCQMVYGPDSTSCGALPTGDGCFLQNNGDVLIAGVVYDTSAFNHIRNNKLYEFETMANLLSANPTDRPKIPDFPNTSIVLKPMLWPVKQGNSYTPLPVFQAPCFNSDPADCDILNSLVNKYVGPEVQDLWKDAVAITANPQPGVSEVDIDFLYGVYTNPSMKEKMHSRYIGAPVVDIDQFYHFQVTDSMWNAMDCMDKAIISQSSNWIYNEDFQPGDYLVLVAMHIMTREQDDWTFNSVWWDNGTGGTYPRNNFGKANAAAAQALGDKLPNPTAFANYQIITTYGQTVNHASSPGQVAGDWPVAYNPYIETAAAHPLETNCRNCHMRGAFPHTTQQAASLDPPFTTNLSSYLSRYGDNPPNALNTFEWSNQNFEYQVTNDFQWSIADRIMAPKPGPVGAKGSDD